ncbi:MAG: DNA adenine methylase [Bacteroidales bacterium]|nr:DNA adenine methylase [Bacteroidales bacterium]
MKPPFSYYGGKQKLANMIVKLIPDHRLFCEPFVGGAAVFFNKPKAISEVEVLNDTNAEIINFYRIVQLDFVSLEKEIRISLHSRRLFDDARVIYNNPHMFTEVKRAWALWVLATQGFAGILDGSWGYDKIKRTTSQKIQNKREAFTEELAYRLQDVQIECTDALRIIRSRDNKDAFFYVDPPYFNSNCAHYEGYTELMFKELLFTLSGIEGKFLLSSYPSDVLSNFVEKFGWHQLSQEMGVSVNKGMSKKRKIEVMTSNYKI